MPDGWSCDGEVTVLRKTSGYWGFLEVVTPAKSTDVQYHFIPKRKIVQGFPHSTICYHLNV